VVIGVVIVYAVAICVVVRDEEVGVEAGTGVGSNPFAPVDAAPVVICLVFSLICWMMRLTMSRLAMVLGGTR
jgi:hypothetical protein